ncbi:uncharacterized protein KZ484_025848 [Pholidichthys leucotaenia]
MEEKYGRESVEKIRDTLMKMNRTDLVQKLSDMDSGTKEKRFRPLSHRVETMASVIELLLETLEAGLTDKELRSFRWKIQGAILALKPPSFILASQLEDADLQDSVFLMVQTFGQESVRKTMKVLEEMKRTDVVQMLSDSSSEAKKKASVDEGSSAVIQKVASMAAVKDLILETLYDLSKEEVNKFKRFVESVSQSLLQRFMAGSSRSEISDVMVEQFGLRSVEVTRDALMKIKRTDLVQRLSETSSEKLSVDEDKSAPLKTGAVMEAAGTILDGLSLKELNKFKCLLRFTCFQKSLPQINFRSLKSANTSHEVVELMMEEFGHQCVEVMMEVLADMKRTDLVQRLSETITELKVSSEKPQPSLSMMVETMASVIELLLETLEAGLTDEELRSFREKINRTILAFKPHSFILESQLEDADLQDSVFLMVQTYGQKSVRKTMKVLEEMKRTDVVQMLSDSSSEAKKKASVDERSSAVIQKVASMAAVKDLILETLYDLSKEEVNEFKEFVKSVSQSLLWRFMAGSSRSEISDVMVEQFGLRSVEVTRDALMKIKRTDLVQRLSETSSEKLSVDEDKSAPLKTEAVMEAAGTILDGLSLKELNKFKCLLRFTCFLKSLPQINFISLNYANTSHEVVELMMEEFGHQCVEVMMEVLADMKRTDLVQRLSETITELKVSSEKPQPSLSMMVETMASVIELLLETLEAGLTDEELRSFRQKINRTIPALKPHSDILESQLEDADLQDSVFLMVQTFGQESVRKTMKVLEEMKRTDVVQMLSDSSSEAKKKVSVDERSSAVIQKVASMAAVKDLILETLYDLSKEEVNEFKEFVKSVSQSLLWRFMAGSSRSEISDVMVEQFGLRSVEVTRDALMKIKRTDLVQRLSETSSEKLSVDEDKSAPLKTGAVMEAAGTILDGLSLKELNKFKCLLRFTCFQKSLPQINFISLNYANTSHEVVELMMEEFGHQCVEVMMEVLADMKRTDLVQRLSETITELKVSSEKPQPSLSMMVETMASVIELLLETLEAGLTDEELRSFREKINRTILAFKPHSFILESQLEDADLQDSVFLMVQTYGQKSVRKTMKVLEEMKRTDVVQMLSDSSSEAKKKASVDERSSAVIQKVASMAAVKDLILETLYDLSKEEVNKFKEFVKSVSQSLLQRFEAASSRSEISDVMVDQSGLRSVEVTRDALMKIKRTDLVQRLSETSSEKLSVDEDKSAPLKTGAVMEAAGTILDGLSLKELNKFKCLLRFTCFQKSLPQINFRSLNYANTSHKVVELMMEEFGHQCVEVMMEVLADMKRTDLVQRLSETITELKGPDTSITSELKDSGSTEPESNNWTKLEPEVNDADEDPTYRLQSEAGHFECSVSGFRWVCEEKVSFRYQFCSWEGHMQRMESRKYMPAGPLMDLTITAGKFTEAHLPHWICIDAIPNISDKFALLHIDDCGDVVEKVSEVTRSHVRLTDPVFSLRAVLIKLGFNWGTSCNVLIYNTNKSFLTLHVYLIPCDPGLKQEVDKTEVSYDSKAIRKPHPQTTLNYKDWFTLTSDLDGAKISPKDLMLQYGKTENYCEVYGDNPDKDFQLKLTRKNELEPVWTCEVRKNDYQKINPTPAAATSAGAPAANVPADAPTTSAGAAAGNPPADRKHFVDQHRPELIQRVTNVMPIVDKLFQRKVLFEEKYQEILKTSTDQDKIRLLYDGPLRAGKRKAKDAFYECLEELEPYLVSDLSGDPALIQTTHTNKTPRRVFQFIRK